MSVSHANKLATKPNFNDILNLVKQSSAYSWIYSILWVDPDMYCTKFRGSSDSINFLKLQQHFSNVKTFLFSYIGWAKFHQPWWLIFSMPPALSLWTSACTSPTCVRANVDLQGAVTTKDFVAESTLVFKEGVIGCILFPWQHCPTDRHIRGLCCSSRKKQR